MKFQLLANTPSQVSNQVFTLAFDQDEEFVSTITDWAMQHGVSAASFTAVGEFERATLVYFEHDCRAHDCHKISIDEPVKILALTGGIALNDEGTLAIHAHCLLSNPNGLTHGGHIVEAFAHPTLQLTLTEPLLAVAPQRGAEPNFMMIAPNAELPQYVS